MKVLEVSPELYRFHPCLQMTHVDDFGVALMADVNLTQPAQLSVYVTMDLQPYEIDV